MRKIIGFGVALLCSAMGLQAQPGELGGTRPAELAMKPTATCTITLVNSLDLARPDEPVVLSRTELEKRLGPIEKGKWLLVLVPYEIWAQLDDLDGDGKWDEAFFPYSFGPKEKVSITLRVGDPVDILKNIPRVWHFLRAKDAGNHFGPPLDSAVMPFQNPPTDFSVQRLPPWQLEGPVWANDKVGFRLYFDTRNGKDIFGMRIVAAMIDAVGQDPDKSYHVLDDWGMDILKVGGSLGAGALALEVPMKGRRDTLIRLGGPSVKREVYHLIAKGPQRAVFRIDYDWIVNGRPVRIGEQISISAGQLYYESKVTVEGAPAGTRLVTGIANFYSNEPGNFNREDAALVYSYGRQSENKDMLGMAIMADRKDLANRRSLPSAGSDVVSTYTLSQYIHKDKPLYFRFYSAWEKTDAGFATRDYFMQMLQHEADRYNHPIGIEP